MATWPIHDQLRLHAEQEVSILLPCQLNIAVDGPAGAGKSTVSRAVAEALGLSYLDTGAMYRALTWKALQRHISPDDADRLVELATETTWALSETGIGADLLMDGQPIPAAIRSDRVTALVSAVSSHQSVRRVVVSQQRELCTAGGFIADGRDIGSVVMPDAHLKVFLTASVAERAERRRLEQGKSCQALQGLTRDIVNRDQQDSSREHSPLRQLADAWVLDTTGMTFDQVVDCILEKARSVCTEGV